MDKIRFWRHSTPLLGVASDEMVSVFETIINGEPLDWLWAQARARSDPGADPYEDSAAWMAVLDSDVAARSYAAFRPSTGRLQRIPVLQVLTHGRKVGTATVAASTTAEGVVWADFQGTEGEPVDLGPFVFDAAKYDEALATPQ